MRTPLWLVLIVIVLGAVASCIVEPLRYDWLACSKTGDCSTGYACYAVSQLPNGVCLQDGNGLEPFKPSEVSPQEATPEEVAPVEPAEETAVPEEVAVPEETAVPEEAAVPEEPTQEAAVPEEPTQEATIPEEPTPEGDGGADT